jgi:hypothetical protein
MLFSAEQIKKIKELKLITKSNLYNNDKIVIDASLRMLNIFIEVINSLSEDKLAKLKDEFLQITNWDDLGFSDELLIACHNSVQNERGLEIIEILISLGLNNFRNTAEDKAIFLNALGQTEEAEKILVELLATEANNIWLYIKLGDLYCLDTVLDEHRNFEKAEAWYYKAYDNNIGKEDLKDWQVLLERLGSVTIERLRSESEKDLLACLKRNNIGTLETLYQLKEHVARLGYNSLILKYLESLLLKNENFEDAKRDLETLNNAYNLMTQSGLDNLSPFEMSKFFPAGENELRIKEETLSFITEHNDYNFTEKEPLAFISQQFLEAQIKFLAQKDEKTGKIRRKLIDKERAQTKKDYENGKFIWMGFVDYRLR